jgi:photosystem II stability/assembly factor-like uncharacterized protein
MFTKENTGSFIVLIVFISLMVISYERVKNVVVEIVDTEKGVETRTRKSIVVNGKKYDGYEKYAYVQEALRKGQIDLTQPSRYNVYPQGYQMTELLKAEQGSFSRRTKNNVTFKEHGPNNFPGRTRGMFVDVSDATQKTWFVGSIGGGIWETADAGKTWTELTKGLPNLAISWLAQSKSNPDVMYATTGEKIFTSISASNGSGVLKSIDHGSTWNYTASTLNSEFVNSSRIIVSPTDDKVLLAVATGDKFFPSDAGDSFIFRSEDGGDNWTKVFASQFVISQIIEDPKNFSKQYAAINNGKIIKSIDGGRTWSSPITVAKTALSSTTGIFNSLENPNIGRIELAIAPKNTNIIYGSLNFSDTESRLYVSFDGGLNWSTADDSSTQTKPDWLRGQGNYDNATMVSPLNDSIVYVAGVGVEQFKVGTILLKDSIRTISFSAEKTENLIRINNLFGDGGTSITPDEFVSVEIRFGVTQKAHRFTVPEGSTSGVPAANYTYQDYVDVPFQIWDIDNNVQLMASFRDNNGNGKFDLNDDPGQSRSYIFVNNITYSDKVPAPQIASNGGYVFRNSFLIWLYTNENITWSESLIQPGATIRLKLQKEEVSTIRGKYTKVGNPYERANGAYVGPNNLFVLHPDHHNMIALNVTANSYSILNANDGGVYISDTSATPGVKNNGWHLISKGYNTTTYYGADKSPTEERYIAGAQDQGTHITPTGITAEKNTEYKLAFGGDGFEVIWHASDPTQIIGGSQFNGMARTQNGGDSFVSADTGMEQNGTSNDGPFVTRVSNSYHEPDLLFAVGQKGVYRSTNFGRGWNYIKIEDPRWSFWSAVDVEASLADPQIVWAGGAMIEGESSANIFLSKDGGYTFNATKNFGDLGLSTGLYSHPYDRNTGYVLFSESGTPKILRSRDLGETWEDLTKFENGKSTNGFPDVATYSLLVMPHDTTQIWAGTEIGIVESLDGGATWALLNNPDFRAVSVWDMKVRGNKIVIATHGRGIWTATIEELLNAVAPQVTLAPLLNSIGQSPEEFSMVVDVKLRSLYDSVAVLFNGKINKVFEPNTVIGDLVLKIPLDTTGTYRVRVEGFKNGNSYRTAERTVVVVPFKEVANSYGTNFDNVNADWSMDRFSIGISGGFRDNLLRTEHPYPEASALGLDSIDLIARLNIPIRVAAEKSTIQYREVVIVEPGEAGTTFGDAEYWDYVIVEGSKDGSVWKPLLSGYDASSDATWLASYTGNQDGRPSMYKDRTINLQPIFKPGDIVQIRFRLHSDPFSSGWGWGIDDLYIQEDKPVVAGLNRNKVTEGVNIFPIPSIGDLNISLENTFKGNSILRIINLSGQEMYRKELNNFNGLYKEKIDINSLSYGIYIIEIDNGIEKYTKKILKF